MPDVILSPSIFAADFAKLGEEIRAAEQAGADWLHVDVIDGHFAPNISMGPFIVETCKRITSLPLDVHLMIEEPERYIDTFVNAGANRLSVHIEGNPNIHRTLQYIRSLGCSPTIVINPGTPVESISAVADLVDMVLVMSVNPGYSGQKFLPSALPKLNSVRSLLDHTNPAALVQIDGGISAATIRDAYLAGARVFVAATAVFKHPGGIAAAIRELRLAAVS